MQLFLSLAKGTGQLAFSLKLYSILYLKLKKKTQDFRSLGVYSADLLFVIKGENKLGLT